MRHPYSLGTKLLVAVFGYFRRASFWPWLGTVTLTVSMYVAVGFTYATLASGAWSGNLFRYLRFYVPFIPVVVLFVHFGIWAVRGSFQYDNACKKS